MRKNENTNNYKMYLILDVIDEIILLFQLDHPYQESKL